MFMLYHHTIFLIPKLIVSYFILFVLIITLAYILILDFFKILKLYASYSQSPLTNKYLNCLHIFTSDSCHLHRSCLIILQLNIIKIFSLLDFSPILTVESMIVFRPIKCILHNRFQILSLSSYEIKVTNF